MLRLPPLLKALKVLRCDRKMCYTIIEQYSYCGHEYTIKTESKGAYEDAHEHSNHRQFLTKPPRTNIISKLLRSFSSFQSEELKPRYRPIASLCHRCQLKENERNSKPGIPWNLADIQAQRRLRAEKALQGGKKYYLCSHCQRQGEGIAIGLERAAYVDLCCENGVKEWQEAEDLVRAGSSLTLLGHPLPQANPQPALSVSSAAARQIPLTAGRESSHHKTPRETGEVQMIGPSAPPRALSLTRSGAMVRLEPRNCQDFSELPGNVHRMQKTDQGTYYQQPGIDINRWEGNPRTYHGQYPIPNPAPQKPLPNIPTIRKPPLSHQAFVSPRAQARQRPGQRAGNQELQPKTPTRYRNPNASTKPPQSSGPTRVRTSTDSQLPPTPVHPLRRSHGKEWRDSAELALRLPATPLTASHLPQLTSLSRHKENPKNNCKADPFESQPGSIAKSEDIISYQSTRFHVHPFAVAPPQTPLQAILRSSSSRHRPVPPPSYLRIEEKFEPLMPPSYSIGHSSAVAPRVNASRSPLDDIVNEYHRAYAKAQERRRRGRLR